MAANVGASFAGRSEAIGLSAWLAPASVQRAEAARRHPRLSLLACVDTPGCTTQACGIRDHRGDYDAAGAVVLGVSPDPAKVVKRFADKQSLNFRLLADEDHSVCELYGVWAEKSMSGRTYWGALRATFILDEAGVVRHVIPKASPKTHDDEVLAALGRLSAAA
jgi:peroxiredoxin Q/BCP